MRQQSIKPLLLFGLRPTRLRQTLAQARYRLFSNATRDRLSFPFDDLLTKSLGFESHCPTPHF